MALERNDIARLQEERNRYLKRIAQAKAGTYNVERRQQGVVVDDLAETLTRFEQIVEGTEALVADVGVRFDA
jgi:hypothetical protein